jgi:Ca-activated chloride channel homolog
VTFGSPLLAFFALGAAVFLAVAFALDFTWRRRQLERIGHAPMLLQMAASLSTQRRVLKVVLLVVGVTLVIVALARPRVEGETTWKQRGIDIALVMDFSKSMLARDVYPSRYERMIFEVEELLEQLEADRVSTVVFAGGAVNFPLSHDHEAAKLLYRGLEPQDLAAGSDIGEAIRVARCVLRPDVVEAGCERIGGRGDAGDPWRMCGPGAAAAPEIRAQEPLVADRARAIILFTDGEDTEGRAHAEVEEAVRLGIEIYVVGVGTTSGELIPEFDAQGRETGWKKDEDGNFVTTRLDQAALLELAALAGGEDRYFRMDPKTYRTGDLALALQRLERGDLDERVVHQPSEIYHWLLFPAFLLLVIEACIGDRRRRRRPSPES